MQGQRSDFEIGEALSVPQYGGGTRHFFLLTLYNFENIGGGGRAPPLTPRSLLWSPVLTDIIYSAWDH